jgi:hypothetical protein
MQERREETPPDKAAATTNMPAAAEANQSARDPSALLPKNETDTFWQRWESIQARFVDDPRGSVQEADSLVEEVMSRLTETFSQQRTNLEGQWSRGGEATTEELRVALQRYRSFFKRLLVTSKSES